MRAALAFVVAACAGAPARTPQVQPAASPGTPAVAGTVVADAAAPALPPPPTTHGEPRASIEAPHAGTIVALAITPDGKTALSCDELGGIRLWPTLDGSREPLVVELPHPKQLAITATTDGYSAIVLDDVGGLVIARLDRGGRTRAHVTLAAEPAYQDVQMTEQGALAWRIDQTIELLGDDGAIKSRLPVEAGERIVDLAVSGRRVIVLLETMANGVASRRVRWLELGTKLSWGAWVPANLANGDQVALAPSGARFATLGHDPKQLEHLSIYDVATGSVFHEQPTTPSTDLGFADDDHVAIATSNAVTWLTLGKKGDKPVPITVPITSNRPNPLLAFGAGRVISATNGELVITAPTGQQYLGYGVESPTIAQAAGNGQLLVGIGDTFVTLDGELRAAGRPKLGVPDITLADARWLGGNDWLVVASSPDGVTRLDLADVATGALVTVRDKLAVVPVLMYEPSTHLVTLSLGDSPEVDRYDPNKRSLEKVASLPKPKGFEQAELVPVAPALADGNELVRVGVRDRPTVQWLHDAKALGKAAATVTIDNASFAGADAAGHVYVWRNTPQNALELVIYAAGKPIGKLPNDGPVALWPDPKGTRVVEVGQRSVALYTLDGKRAWVQELAGTTEALWLSDGAIAIVSAAGIARLDAATGQVTAARCGWRFELSAKPHPASPQIEPVCAQLSH